MKYKLQSIQAALTCILISSVGLLRVLLFMFLGSFLNLEKKAISLNTFIIIIDLIFIAVLY